MISPVHPKFDNGKHNEHQQNSDRISNTNKLQWKLRIQTFQDSGLTQQQWCEKEGVKLSALRYWLRHFREEKSQEAAPDWLKVCVSDTDPIPSLALPQVSPPAEDPVLPIRLHIHDMMLEIPAGTPPACLSALLQVVRQA